MDEEIKENLFLFGAIVVLAGILVPAIEYTRFNSIKVGWIILIAVMYFVMEIVYIKDFIKDLVCGCGFWDFFSANMVIAALSFLFSILLFGFFAWIYNFVDIMLHIWNVLSAIPTIIWKIISAIPEISIAIGVIAGVIGIKFLIWKLFVDK